MQPTSGFQHVTAIAVPVAKTSSSDAPFSDRTATDQATLGLDAILTF
jgi:hypothetical protein